MEMPHPRRTLGKNSVGRGASGSSGAGGLEIHAVPALREAPELLHRGRRHGPDGLHVELAVLRRQRHELAAEVASLRLPEEPVGPPEAAALLPVALLGRDVLDLDVVAHLEVRHRQRRLPGHELRLEDAPIGLPHPEAQDEARGRLLLRLLAHGLLALDAQDFVLQHLAGAIVVDPGRRVVEDPRGGALHAMAGLLPQLEVANDGAPVEAVGLEVGGPFDEVHRVPQLHRPGADGDALGEGPAQGRRIPPGEGLVREAEARVGVLRVLGEALGDAVEGRLRVAAPLEDLGDARRDVLALWAPLLDAPELLDGGLVVVTREGHLEAHVRFRLELLEPRGDLVRLLRGPVLAEGFEVAAEPAGILREALRRLLEDGHALGPPPEAGEERRELLEHLRRAAELLGQGAQGRHRFAPASLLRVVEDEPCAGIEELRVLGDGPAPQIPLVAAAVLLGHGRVVAARGGGGLEGEGRGILGGDEGLEEHRGHVVHAVVVGGGGPEHGLQGRRRHGLRHVTLDGVHPRDRLRRHRRVTGARIGVRRQPRGGAVELHDADARRVPQHADDDAMAAGAHVNAGAEALPHAPLPEIPLQHRHVVDPHLDGALGRDDEVRGSFAVK